MSAANVVPGPDGPGADNTALRAKWRRIVALGVVYILAGLIALSSVALATVAKLVVVGVMMLVAGVSEVVSAFQVKSWSKFLSGLCSVRSTPSPACSRSRTRSSRRRS